MNHNAYTIGPVTLYRVWGPDEYPVVTPPHNSPVMVIWSPVFQQYIMSITTLDYRYDSFVRPDQFRPDPALQVTDGPSYYLHQAQNAAKNFSK